MKMEKEINLNCQIIKIIKDKCIFQDTYTEFEMLDWTNFYVFATHVSIHHNIEHLKMIFLISLRQGNAYHWDPILASGTQLSLIRTTANEISL